MHANPIRIPHGGETLGYEYRSACPKLVTLFIASIAWRASVSSHMFFQRVKLGPYEETIRSALLCEQGLPSHFEVVVSEFEKVSGAFLNPHYTKLDDVRILVVYANRFGFYAKIDKRRWPDPFERFAVRPGRVTTSCLRNFEQTKEFQLIRKVALSNPTAFKRHNR